MSSLKVNFIYNLIYNVLALFIPLVTMPYISRVLGADGIGKYSYANSIAYYFILFAMLGLNNYGNRTIAAIRDDKLKLKKTFWSIYSMQVITAGISILMYVIYACVFSNNKITWILFLYVISSIYDVNWLFFGLEKFKITVCRNFCIKIITTIAIFLFVKDNGDTFIYSAILVLGSCISNAVLWPYIKKYVGFTKVTFDEVIVHFKPNFVLFIPFIAVSLYKTMDKIMLGNMTNIENVGFYESAEKFVNVPMTLVTSLGTVMLPRISNMYAKDDGYIKEYMYKSIQVLLLMTSIVCFGIMSIANIFVPLFFGKGFEVCIVLLKILLPSCLFLAVANVIRTQYLIPLKKDNIFIKSLLLGAICNLLVNLMLIPYYQAIGAAIGTLVAEGVVCLYQMYSIRKDININNSLFSSCKYIFSGIIMFLILANMDAYDGNPIFLLFRKVILGGIIFFTCIFLIIVLEKFIERWKGVFCDESDKKNKTIL